MLLALLGSGAAAAAPPPAVTPSIADTNPPVKEVTIDPNAKEPVCRRQAPTGSRIARERCAAAEPSRAERDQLRRDIEEVRMREVMRDQARAAADLEALRRRSGL
jgi:hypothetical protein